MFKDFSDVSEKTICEIKKISILEKEYYHVNKSLQQNYAGGDKMIRWFFNIIILSIGVILSTTAGFSIKLIESGNKYEISDIETVIPFLFSITKYAGYFSVSLFSLYIITNMLRRRILVIRKKRILDCFNKIEEKNLKGLN